MNRSGVDGWQTWRDSVVGYVVAVALNLALVWAVPVSAAARRRGPLPLARVAPPPEPPVEFRHVAVPYETDRASLAERIDRARPPGESPVVDLNTLRRRTIPLRHNPGADRRSLN